MKKILFSSGLLLFLMLNTHGYSQSIENKRKDTLTSNETVSFSIVESIPVYNGCENSPDKNHCFNTKIRRFIGKHFDASSAKCLKYEMSYDKKLKKKVPVCKKEIKESRVKIKTSFVIDTLGHTTNILAKSPYPTLNKEAVRVIKKLPKFKPGVQRGRKVRVRYALPISFNIF